MSTLIAILGLLLTFLTVLEITGLLLGQKYEETFKVFVITIISCAVLLLLNDAVITKTVWITLATTALIISSAIMLLCQIVLTIIQCCKSEFKVKWDADVLVLLAAVVLAATGYTCFIWYKKTPPGAFFWN